MSVSLIGTVIIYTLNVTQRAAKMLGLCFVAVFAVNIPLCLSLVTSNIAGATKRSTVSVGVFAAYCVGNIVGLQFFLASEEPKYPTGIRASLCGFAIGILFLILLLAYYIWENKRRDSQQGAGADTDDNGDYIEERSGRTDRQISGFRYVL
ncbi:major facilitator superfamily domain-containing protein [Penicillium taxi]|uniref:major facilitator superfamily domain-containing protein n=1 Tax=Penicillium taxi TaxID=168475 RepID=UPI00254536D6|nr:major facilitator superfamily domain-containing protein [Penicillium taxi]KAJ5898984.1 major facilitator superfamily domain-containing protein [Penicillium taxi]